MYCLTLHILHRMYENAHYTGIIKCKQPTLIIILYICISNKMYQLTIYGYIIIKTLNTRSVLKMGIILDYYSLNILRKKIDKKISEA